MPVLEQPHVLEEPVLVDEVALQDRPVVQDHGAGAAADDREHGARGPTTTPRGGSTISM